MVSNEEREKAEGNGRRQKTRRTLVLSQKTDAQTQGYKKEDEESGGVLYGFAKIVNMEYGKL